jgi:hypothetical protein
LQWYYQWYRWGPSQIHLLLFSSFSNLRTALTRCMSKRKNIMSTFSYIHRPQYSEVYFSN